MRPSYCCLMCLFNRTVKLTRPCGRVSGCRLLFASQSLCGGASSRRATPSPFRASSRVGRRGMDLNEFLFCSCEIINGVYSKQICERVERARMAFNNPFRGGAINVQTRSSSAAAACRHVLFNKSSVLSVLCVVGFIRRDTFND